MGFFSCCCSGGGGSFTVTQTVRGCGSLPLTGVLVELYQGSLPTLGPLVGTCTTSSVGVCTFTGLAAGPYTIFFSKSRFNNAASAFTLTGNLSRNNGLTIADPTNFVCCSTCPDPVPRVLTHTDAMGSRTATYNPSGQFGAAWYDTVSVPGVSPCVTNCSNVCVTGTATISVTSVLFCPASAGGNWSHVQITSAIVSSSLGCPPSGVVAYDPLHCAGSSPPGDGVGPTVTPVSAACGVPLAVSFSLSSTWPLAATVASLPGPYSGTSSYSE